jgi:hypothetical protein
MVLDDNRRKDANGGKQLKIKYKTKLKAKYRFYSMGKYYQHIPQTTNTVPVKTQISANTQPTLLAAGAY